MSFTQQTPTLFKPVRVGRLTLQHRVVLAPMTRLRGYASCVPGPYVASYYSQRASTPGSLLIAESTIISHNAGGKPHATGIYTDTQIQAWKKGSSLSCPLRTRLTTGEFRLRMLSTPRGRIFFSSSGHSVVLPTYVSSRTTIRPCRTSPHRQSH